MSSEDERLIGAPGLFPGLFNDVSGDRFARSRSACFPDFGSPSNKSQGLAEFPIIKTNNRGR